MIKSFAHKGLKQFFESGITRGIQVSHAAKIRRILTLLDNAETIDDMRLPGFKLHRLMGNRDGSWSVWISGNWRLTFRFEGGDAETVSYEDYH